MTTEKQFQKFSDFAEADMPLQGAKKKLSDILGKEVLVTDYRISDSQYKTEKYLTLQFQQEKQLFVIFTGSMVLINQILKYRDHLPFLATIEHVGKYYTFT